VIQLSPPNIARPVGRGSESSPHELTGLNREQQRARNLPRGQVIQHRLGAFERETSSTGTAIRPARIALITLSTRRRQTSLQDGSG
jgi:hypothetical protein